MYHLKAELNLFHFPNSCSQTLRSLNSNRYPIIMDDQDQKLSLHGSLLFLRLFKGGI